MWTVEQWGVLLGVIAVVLTALAGMAKAITDLVVAFRKRDNAPAPQVGIPAAPPPAQDDIDYRAYLDMLKRAETAEKQRDELLQILTRRQAATGLDEDTHPIPPKETQ